MRSKAFALAIGIALVAAGCSGGTKVATGKSGSAPIVLLANIAPYGQVLTTTTGFVLYTYTADKPGGPGCDAGCLAIWPPLLLPAGETTPVGGTGVTGLGTFHRGGQLQVTLNGMPLYTFVSDKEPGQVTGQNYQDSGGTWILAVEGSATGPSGTSALTAPPTTPTAVTSPPTTKAPATQPAVTQAPAAPTPVTSPPATSPPPPPSTSPPTSPPPTNPPGPAF